MASVSYLVRELLRTVPEEPLARVLKVPPELLRERLVTKDWADYQEDLIYRMCRSRGICVDELPPAKGAPPQTAIGEFCSQFGGPRGLANLLGVSVFTLRSWASGFPAHREAQVREAFGLCSDPRRFELIPGAWGKGFGIIRTDTRRTDAR